MDNTKLTPLTSDDEPRFLAYRGVSFESRVVQFFTWAGLKGVSHIAIKPLPCTDVVEAWQGSVQHSADYRMLHTKGTSVDVYRYINPPALDTAGAYVWLMEQVGKPYDYLGILHFIDRHSGNDSGVWFCSELAAAYARRLGMPLFSDQAPDYKITPVMLTYSPVIYKEKTITV